MKASFVTSYLFRGSFSTSKTGRKEILTFDKGTADGEKREKCEKERGSRG
jgi:hypothetical protein